MKKAVFLAVCVILIAASSALCLSVPSLINYQGVLTDANGNLITGTLTKDMIFAVYDSPNPPGGVMKWGPETRTVQIINGQFNVLLGSVLTNPAITTAFDGPNRYLSIKVDNVELLPRQQVLSTGYAVQAERALHGVPAGTVVSYFGNTAPTGWLMCNGSAIPAGSEYDTLRALVGNNVPDLRGIFLRGLNNGRNDDKADPDVNRIVGSYQSDSFSSHSHNYESETEITGWGGNNSGYKFVTQVRTTKLSEVSGGNETRPKNIAVNYIIKY